MRLSVIVSLVCLCLIGMANAGDAKASIRKNTDIPVEGLGVALQTLAKDYDFQVLYHTEIVQGLNTKGASGSLTPEEALGKVLQGTGLSYKYLDANTITVFALSAPTATSSAAGQDQTQSPKNERRAGNKDSQDFRLAQVGQANTGPQVTSDATPRKDESLTEIVVTGTHIHDNASKINPLIVIDQAQIQRSGYSSTQDLFRSLPQNFQNSAASEDGFLSGSHASTNNIDFGTGVDLRGLGPNSTLTLLNGHRLAPSASGSFVDISQIPLTAIDRIEILTDGSSAVYGSDAVGGVVNIILKKDYQGADTSVRYGASTAGGRDELLVSQALGSEWETGNAVGTLQFQRQGALPAADRPDSAGALTIPNDLFPKNRSYGLTLDGRQSIFEGLEFLGDVLASKRESTQFSSSRIDAFSNYYIPTHSDANSVNVSPSLRYSLPSHWTMELNALYGYQRSKQSYSVTAPGTFYSVDLDNRFTERSIDLILDGQLVSTAAGRISIAVGGSYRSESFSGLQTSFSPGSDPFAQSTAIDRHVTAEFAELHLPITGAANNIPFIQTLEASVALRRDRYSDFGSTTNPHLGLRWAPTAEVSLRASYGKSFRAPNAAEEVQAHQQAYIFTDEFTSPDGTTTVPAFTQIGSKVLTAEKARTWNYGLEYKPLTVPGLSLAVDCFDIRYADRIVQPTVTANFLQVPGNYGLVTAIANDAAAQAIVDSFVAGGGQFINDIADTNPSGVTGVRYLIDGRQQNAELVRQSGLDFTAQFAQGFGAYIWASQISVAFIDKIDTQYAPGLGFVNQVNTYGSPVKWRARLSTSWGSAAYSLNGAVNSVGSYIDTNGLGNPPVASWTTADLNATLNFDAFLQSYAWRGLSASLIVLNAFDREPPFVPSLSNGFNPSNYDGANANPLGRFIAVSLRKKW